MTELAVRVDQLTKRYRDGTVAVGGVSFDVAADETFGLLGPNGAGKTTVVRVLVTLLRPTAGTASVAGHSITGDPASVRRSIGYSAQQASVDELLTVNENLVLAARLYGAGKRSARARATQLCDQLDLGPVASRPAGSLSGGMRRRVDLAQALAARPAVLFLDEPTTGLDPESRRGLWDQLRQLRADGVTVVLTTQYLEEADQLCDRVAILHAGTIAAIGATAALKRRVGRQVINVTLPSHAAAGQTADAVQALAGLPGAKTPVTSLRSVMVAFPGGDHLTEVASALEERGITPAAITAGEPTLDDVYLHYTGGRRPDSAPEADHADADAAVTT